MWTQFLLNELRKDRAEQRVKQHEEKQRKRKEMGEAKAQELQHEQQMRSQGVGDAAGGDQTSGLGGTRLFASRPGTPSFEGSADVATKDANGSGLFRQLSVPFGMSGTPTNMTRGLKGEQDATALMA